MKWLDEKERVFPAGYGNKLIANQFSSHAVRSKGLAKDARVVSNVERGLDGRNRDLQANVKQGMYDGNYIREGAMRVCKSLPS